ncbi:MAG: hypothetical protein LT106_02965 [Burkholderiaceae bacterium]|nr:hypothetical protein [Burkholderiaceae bacterium]
MSTLLWRDMLIIGTAVNAVATFVALMLAARGTPSALVAAVHFAPLPYNVFLWVAIWRSPGRTTQAALLSTVWLAVMTLV